LLFISVERLAANPPEADPTPLRPAPELIVEILSPSDKISVLSAKIADYRTADVREIWLVRSDAQTVEVLALSWDEILTIATYGAGETVVSQIFPDLAVAVDAIFAL
jgi:Uma2 family endonuclease